MSKKYVKLGSYADNLVLPVSMLEKILEEGYLVQTSYDSSLNRDVVSSVKPIEKVELIDQAEIKAVLAQQMLKGEQ